MGDATLLNLDTIAAGQLQMYQTSNDADAELEKATNDLLAVTLSGDVTLTGPQFTRAFTFVCSGNAAPHNLTVPATKRIFCVENNGSAALSVVCGSSSVSVAAGDLAVLKTDGTANGLKAVVGSSGSSGAAGGDLTGTYPNPTIGAGKVSLAKMANMAADSIIGNNTGSPATPLALTTAQVKTLLALTTADVSGAEDTANKGANNGYAGLDSGGKVPTAQLPSSVTGALHYLGTWNASTNSPALASGVGVTGGYYKVSVAGTTSIDSHSHWNIGDSIVFDGSVWDKIDGIESEVISVAGQTGVVTLAVADVSGAAPLASPPLTGVPTAPTAAGGTNTTQLATCAFVEGELAGGTAPTGSAGGDLTGTFPNPTVDVGKITLAKMASLSASSIIGNNTGSPATPLALTTAQVKTLLAIAIGDLSNIADARIVGNNSGVAGPPIVLTAAQVKSLLSIASGDVSGLAASATTDTTSANNISSGTLAAARLAAIRYDISTYYPGIPGSSQLVLRWQAPRAVTIPSGGTNSQASSASAATASTTFTIKQNGSSVGTIVWGVSGTTGTFTVSSTVNIVAGDVLTITGPASADATIADISIVLAGTA